MPHPEAARGEPQWCTATWSPAPRRRPGRCGGRPARDGGVCDGSYPGRVSGRTTPKDPIVWVDCEMTGLDLDRDALIEVAVVVTDSELVPVDAGIDLTIRPTPGAVEQMNDVVRTM